MSRPLSVTNPPLLSLALAWLLFTLPACSMAPPPAAQPLDPASLDGREFVSTAVDEGNTQRTLVRDTRIRLTFRNGQLGAYAGCNSLGAAYDVVDGRLMLGQMSTTEMGCPRALSAQDEWLAAFLGSAPELALEGDTVTLASSGTVITLLDREVAEPDLELVGSLWILDTMITGDAASSVPAGVTASLRFGADGRVKVDTGCNTGDGGYTATDDSITFAPIALTRIGCPGPEGDVERMILAVLTADRVAYDIEARNLTLKSNGRGLVFRPAD